MFGRLWRHLRRPHVIPIAVQRFDLRPGERAVITSSRPLYEAEIKMIQAQWPLLFPDVKALVLEHPLELKIVPAAVEPPSPVDADHFRQGVPHGHDNAA